MKRGKLTSAGKRLAQVAGVLLVAAIVMLVAYEILGPDDKEIASGPPPVQVRVLAPDSFQSAHRFAPYYVVPDKRVARPAKLSRAATNLLGLQPAAALNEGALAGSPQIVRLRLRSTTGKPVTVKGVSFKVVSQARPLKGWFTAQPACSFARVRVARVNLDSRRPRARYAGPSGASSRSLSLDLTRAATTVLELQVTTSRHRAAWTARLKVSTDGGRSQSVTVDDHGRPFRVTSARSSRAYAPRFGATGITGFARRPAWDGGRVRGC
jgi:hypothetical protein